MEPEGGLRRMTIDIDEEKIGDRNKIIFETFDKTEIRNMWTMDNEYNDGVEDIKRALIYGDGGIFYEEEINEDTEPNAFINTNCDLEEIKVQIKEMLKGNRRDVERRSLDQYYKQKLAEEYLQESYIDDIKRWIRADDPDLSDELNEKIKQEARKLKKQGKKWIDNDPHYLEKIAEGDIMFLAAYNDEEAIKEYKEAIKEKIKEDLDNGQINELKAQERRRTLERITED